MILRVDRAASPGEELLESVATRRNWHVRNRGAWEEAGLGRDAEALIGGLSLRLARALGKGESVKGADALGSAKQAAESLAGACAHADAAVAAASEEGRAGDPARAARRCARAWEQLADFYHEVLLSARGQLSGAGGAPADGSGGSPGGEMDPAVAKLFLEEHDARGSVAAQAVECTVRALSCGGGGGGGRRGGSGARTTLLRVLSLLSGDAAARAAFAERWGEVPLWLFLPWAQQMLSFITGPEGEVFFPVLRRLREEYPRALDYPLLLAREVTFAPPEARERVEALAALRRSAVAERFARAVEDLTATAPRLKAWMDRMDPLKRAVKAEVVEVLRGLRADLLPTDEEAAGRMLPGRHEEGFFRGKFDEESVRKAVEKALREAERLAVGESLPAATLKDVRDALGNALKGYRCAGPPPATAALILSDKAGWHGHASPLCGDEDGRFSAC